MEEISKNLTLMRTLRRLGTLISVKATPFKGQGRILGILRRENGKSITQRELLERTEMKSSSLSEIVKKLVDGGFITQTIDTKDKRNMRLLLTDSGEAESLRMREVSSKLADKAFAILNEEEKDILISLLTKLKEYWEVAL